MREKTPRSLDGDIRDLADKVTDLRRDMDKLVRGKTPQKNENGGEHPKPRRRLDSLAKRIGPKPQ